MIPSAVPQRTVMVMSTVVMEGVEEEEEHVVEDFSPPWRWREPVLLVELTTLGSGGATCLLS